MNGIELITKEREEQLKKHGFSKDHDSEHTGAELVLAALYVLTDQDEFFPTNWNQSFKEKLSNKNPIDALKVAGALLAAEIDRLQGV